MKIIVSVTDRADDLSFVAKLHLQTTGGADGPIADGDRQSRFILASEPGKKLVDDMNDGGHGGTS